MVVPTWRNPRAQAGAITIARCGTLRDASVSVEPVAHTRRYFAVGVTDRDAARRLVSAVLALSSVEEASLSIDDSLLVVVVAPKTSDIVIEAAAAVAGFAVRRIGSVPVATS